MVIYLAADHRGYNLKESIKRFLLNGGYEVFDVGNEKYEEGDDYPDFAVKLAKNVGLNAEFSRGIAICGSGVGVDVVANKFRNVRSALAVNADQIYDARHDDNANVLSVAADFTNETDAQKIVEIFLTTPFGNEERHRRRLDKINQLENA